MKKLKSFKIGAIWTVSYMLAVGILMSFLPYSPFRIGLNPFVDWVRLIEDFVNNKLVIDTGKEVLIAVAFIAFWPLWFVGLRCCLKKKWTIASVPTSSENQKIVIKKHKMERPPMMSAPVNFTRPADYVEGKSESEVVVPAAASDVPEEIEEKPVEIDFSALVPKIREIVEGSDMDIFENVLLDETKVPVVVASDTRAYLLTFLANDQEWVADEEPTEEGEAPTWFSSEGLVPSPFYQMKQAAEILREQEAGSTVVPVVVILNGEVLNYGSMVETWEKQGGYVVRFENGKPEEMMTLDVLLREKK